MSFAVFNKTGNNVGDIFARSMTKKAAIKLAIKWFGKGSTVLELK
jgi:hypothetical protein